MHDVMGQLKALRLAFSDGDIDKIIQILQAHPDLDINRRDETHGLQTYLMRLCHLHIEMQDRAAILYLFMDMFLDVNIQDGTGRTALTHACIAEKMDVIECLGNMCDNCDPNIADYDGNTPLLYAVKSRNVDLVKLILDCFMDKGLDVQAVNNKGVCALAEAENHCDSEICRALINEGKADISVLEKITFPRETSRHLKTPRAESPTPEKLSLHTRRKSLPKSRGDTLSPLVVNGKVKTPPEDFTPRPIYTPQESQFETMMEEKESDSDDEALSDVKEETENEIPESESEKGYIEPAVGLSLRKRRNSLSLPDLRENSGSLVTSTPSSLTSYSDDAYPRHENSNNIRIERRFTTQQTFREETPLPHLSEEEEGDAPSEAPSQKYMQRRRNSASLPDLLDNDSIVAQKQKTSYSESKQDKTKLCQTKYRTSDDHLDCKHDAKDSTEDDADRLSQSYGEGNLKLPQLNINCQLSGSLPYLPKVHRSGFSGNPSFAVLRNKAMNSINSRTTTMSNSRTLKKYKKSESPENTVTESRQLHLRGAKLKNSLSQYK